MKARPLRLLLALGFLLAFVGVGLVVQRHNRPANVSGRGLESLRLQVLNLSPDEGKSYKERLEKNPDDFELRCLLASYYADNHPGDFFTRPRESQARMLWIVRNHPDTPRAGEFTGWDHESYAKARDLWLESSERYRDDPSVLGNAGLFFSQCDPDRAVPLLAEAQRLDPTNAKWSQTLGQSYAMKHSTSIRDSQESAEFSAKALDAYQRALPNSDVKARKHLVKQAVLSALRAGDLENAERHARELIDSAIESNSPAELDLQNAGCLGNLVIGYAAFERGDLEKAEEHLLQIAATAHPQQLSTPGPMNLADALLMRGRTESVIEYLRRCQQASKYAKFGEWISQIESGETPKFNTGRWY